ncbi:Oidioi.mRNA.OKI2018_I69.chr2.g5043.t1.cds [Oikopleura dioica]|uniref:Oidioi.mRNA.OKI2018_I69.chr2.g5043.t1.cds n=1 Tax=Oikopleura dioica TaxID=34765 RepID=A0ABN7SZB8_OIKDI|nr:Oidioi.mRNA.OKI2018_I69.chr2.g5043.t1.cds [Oikopleura dioica]
MAKPRVRFLEHVAFISAPDYKRKIKVPWDNLTNEEKCIAKLELNFFKATEMIVHPKSQSNTSMIFIEPAVLQKMAKFKKKYKQMIQQLPVSTP